MALLGPAVFVGIPSGTEWKADFGMSLAGLMSTIQRPLKDGSTLSKLQLWNTKGSILPQSRTVLVQKAMEAKCSHLLFLDSDQTFPAWVLHQLLSHKKKVVAANVATKELPANPTARQFNVEKIQGDLVYTTEKSKGLEEVWRVGTGIMLIDLSVFDKIPQPWFPMTWNEDQNHWVGEDWNFCSSLQKLGVPIYVDHDLSKHVGHVGSFTYLHDHVEMKE